MLTCCTNLGVFESCQEVGKEGLRVKDVIVCKDGDCGSYFFQTLDHLQPLIGLWCTEDPHPGCNVEALADLADVLHARVGRYDNDATRLASDDSE